MTAPMQIPRSSNTALAYDPARGRPAADPKTFLNRFYSAYLDAAQRLSPRSFDWTNVPAAERDLGVTRPPVLVVGGYIGDREVYEAPIRSLRARGFTVAGIDQALHGFGSIRHQAYRIKRAVEALKAETGAPTVQILAHSVGGAAAMYYVDDLGGTKDVSHVVSLGSPIELHPGDQSQSSALNALGRAMRRIIPSVDFGCVLHELEPASAFAQELTDRREIDERLDRAPKTDFRWNAISANANGAGDGMILLKTSVAPEDGAWYANVVLKKPDANHFNIAGIGPTRLALNAWDPDAKRAVLQLLSGATTAAVTRDLRSRGVLDERLTTPR